MRLYSGLVPFLTTYPETRMATSLLTGAAALLLWNRKSQTTRHPAVPRHDTPASFRTSSIVTVNSKHHHRDPRILNTKLEPVYKGNARQFRQRHGADVRVGEKTLRRIALNQAEALTDHVIDIRKPTYFPTDGNARKGMWKSHWHHPLSEQMLQNRITNYRAYRPPHIVAPYYRGETGVKPHKL